MPPAGSDTDRCELRSATVEIRVGEEVGHVRAVPNTATCILERKPHTPDLVRQGRLEPGEEPEPLERRDTLGRRRQLDHFVAAVTSRQGLDPLRLVRRKILLVEPADRADRLRDRPAVDSRRAFVGDRAQRRRELDQPDALAAPRGRGQLGGDRRGRPRRPGAARNRPCRRALRADGEAALRDVDRIGQARFEAQASVPLAERDPACDGSGNGDGPRPELVDRSHGICTTRRRPGRVEALHPSVAPHEREAIAADTGGHRLRHAQDRGRRQRRVRRVPAAFEHPKAGAGRERLARRHHRVGGDRRRAPVGRSEPRTQILAPHAPSVSSGAAGNDHAILRTWRESVAALALPTELAAAHALHRSERRAVVPAARESPRGTASSAARAAPRRSAPAFPLR